MSRAFRRDIPDPWGCSKGLRKRSSCFFSFVWRQLITNRMQSHAEDLLSMTEDKKNHSWAFGNLEREERGSQQLGGIA